MSNSRKKSQYHQDIEDISGALENLYREAEAQQPTLRRAIEETGEIAGMDMKFNLAQSLFMAKGATMLVIEHSGKMVRNLLHNPPIHESPSVSDSPMERLSVVSGDVSSQEMSEELLREEESVHSPQQDIISNIGEENKELEIASFPSAEGITVEEEEAIEMEVLTKECCVRRSGLEKQSKTLLTRQPTSSSLLLRSSQAGSKHAIGEKGTRSKAKKSKSNPSLRGSQKLSSIILQKGLTKEEIKALQKKMRKDTSTETIEVPIRLQCCSGKCMRSFNILKPDTECSSCAMKKTTDACCDSRCEQLAGETSKGKPEGKCCSGVCEVPRSDPEWSTVYEKAISTEISRIALEEIEVEEANTEPIETVDEATDPGKPKQTKADRKDFIQKRIEWKKNKIRNAKEAKRRLSIEVKREKARKKKDAKEAKSRSKQGLPPEEKTFNYKFVEQECCGGVCEGGQQLRSSDKVNIVEVGDVKKRVATILPEVSSKCPTCHDSVAQEEAICCNEERKCCEKDAIATRMFVKREKEIVEKDGVKLLVKEYTQKESIIFEPTKNKSSKSVEWSNEKLGEEKSDRKENEVKKVRSIEKSKSKTKEEDGRDKENILKSKKSKSGQKVNKEKEKNKSYEVIEKKSGSKAILTNESDANMESLNIRDLVSIKEVKPIEESISKTTEGVDLDKENELKPKKSKSGQKVTKEKEKNNKSHEVIEKKSGSKAILTKKNNPNMKPLNIRDLASIKEVKPIESSISNTMEGVGLDEENELKPKKSKSGQKVTKGKEKNNKSYEVIEKKSGSKAILTKKSETSMEALNVLDLIWPKEVKSIEKSKSKTKEQDGKGNELQPKKSKSSQEEKKEKGKNNKSFEVNKKKSGSKTILSKKSDTDLFY